MRKVREDIPRQGRGIERGLERLENIGSYNANSKAPSELRASVKNNNEVPTPPMKPARLSSRILKPVGLPESTTVKLPRTSVLLDWQSSLERLPLLRSQIPYAVEKGPGSASSITKSISNDMSEDDKGSPSSTSLPSVRDVQVGPEPRITHGGTISQNVNLGYGHNGLNPNKIERRRSIIFADVEPSTMIITRERGVQDTVEPESIVLKPDNKARASMVDQSDQTMPPTLIDTNNSSQDGDDVSFVDGPLCFHLSCVYCLIDQADAGL